MPIRQLTSDRARHRQTSHAQHDRCGVDTDHFGTSRSSVSDGDPGPASDVDESFACIEFGEVDRQLRGAVTSEQKRHAATSPLAPEKPGWVPW